MQSSDYAPGVSGWKFDPLSGDYEINSCTLGSLNRAPARQMVSVEVASYSKHDMPKNAGELLAFMQAELQKVPAEYRQAAEFEDFDACYGDEPFSQRVFLSYKRLETEEELADRIEKSKVAGTRLSLVDGVFTIAQDGVTRVQLRLSQPAPFIVIDGETYISQAEVERASIAIAKLGDDWKVKMASTPSGEKFVSGIGPVLESHESQFLVEADRWAINAHRPEDAMKAAGMTSMLDTMASKISETSLGKDLLSEISRSPAIAEQIRDVIRAELRPGGMLHLR